MAIEAQTQQILMDQQRSEAEMLEANGNAIYEYRANVDRQNLRQVQALQYASQSNLESYFLKMEAGGNGIEDETESEKKSRREFQKGLRRNGEERLK